MSFGLPAEDPFHPPPLNRGYAHENFDEVLDGGAKPLEDNDPDFALAVSELVSTG